MLNLKASRAARDRRSTAPGPALPAPHPAPPSHIPAAQLGEPESTAPISCPASRRSLLVTLEPPLPVSATLAPIGPVCPFPPPNLALPFSSRTPSMSCVDQGSGKKNCAGLVLSCAVQGCGTARVRGGPPGPRPRSQRVACAKLILRGGRRRGPGAEREQPKTARLCRGLRGRPSSGLAVGAAAERGRATEAGRDEVTSTRVQQFVSLHLTGMMLSTPLRFLPLLPQELRIATVLRSGQSFRWHQFPAVHATLPDAYLPSALPPDTKEFGAEWAIAWADRTIVLRQTGR